MVPKHNVPSRLYYQDGFMATPALKTQDMWHHNPHYSVVMVLKCDQLVYIENEC